MKILLNSLPLISDQNVSAITDEWKLYRAEEIPKSVLYDKEENLKRIDSYRDYVLSTKNKAGALKYPHLTKVVQTCLSIAHGNADVERSLSINKKILTPERTCLSEESLNGLRMSRDVVSMFGKVADVPVTKELLSSVRQAHKKYTERRGRKNGDLDEREKNRSGKTKQTKREGIT